MRDPCLPAGVPFCFNNKDDSDDSGDSGDDSGGHHGHGHHDDRGDDGGGHHDDSRHYAGGRHGDGGQGVAGGAQPSRTLTVTVNLGFRATWRVGPTRRCRAGR